MGVYCGGGLGGSLLPLHLEQDAGAQNQRNTYQHLISDTTRLAPNEGSTQATLYRILAAASKQKILPLEKG